MIRPVIAAALVFLALARPLGAHPIPFSYLDLRLQTASIEGTLIVHDFDVAHELNLQPVERLLDPGVVGQHADAIVRIIAHRLALMADGRPIDLRWSAPEVVTERQSVRLRFGVDLERAPGMLALSASLFPYDANHQTFVNIYEGDGLTQAILDANRAHFEYFSGTRQGVAAVIQRFVPAGIHHILIGPDHLLFLVGLLLLGGTLRQLALVVTAFTVAHSITLSLAALNLVSPPASLIEPAIALSIVYVGADNLLVRDGRDMRAWIAFAFGFIHGFGFANVLREMDLPSRALGWSLFSFNFGVELGQLLVVLLVATAFAALRARSEAAGRWLLVTGSVVVVAAGTFWFVQRVFFSGGMQ
jgi:hydrogenase/urease accessory protein HupE